MTILASVLTLDSMADFLTARITARSREDEWQNTQLNLSRDASVSFAKVGFRQLMQKKIRQVKKFLIGKVYLEKCPHCRIFQESGIRLSLFRQSI
jgi:hypothetical protein